MRIWEEVKNRQEEFQDLAFNFFLKRGSRQTVSKNWTQKLYRTVLLCDRKRHNTHGVVTTPCHVWGYLYPPEKGIPSILLGRYSLSCQGRVPLPCLGDHLGQDHGVPPRPDHGQDQGQDHGQDYGVPQTGPGTGPWTD